MTASFWSVRHCCTGRLLERQQLLHGQIVEALETLTTEVDAETATIVKRRWRESDQIERLAHHAVRGHVWAKALPYCQQAGEKAMARSAHREACSYFEQALLALGHLPESRATREQAIDLRLALRSALHPSGELEHALARVREAEALAVALDDHHRLGQVLAAVSLHCYLMGAYDDAVSAAQRALALAADVGESNARLLATLQLGFAHQALGEYRQAIECLS